jgi:hypothetical protein
MGMSQAAHSTPQKTPGLQRPLPLRRGRRHTIDTRLELGQALCFFGITVDMITINYGYNHDIYIYTYMYVCNVM